jgi:hypothetical protein
MRDRTARKNYSPEAEEFRRQHARHREWGLAQRHGEKLRRLRNSRRDAQAASMAECHQEDQTLAPSPPSLAYPPTPAPRERAMRPEPAPRERAVRPEPAPCEQVIDPEPITGEQVTRPKPTPIGRPARPEPARREQPARPTPAASPATGREISRRPGRRDTLPGPARQRPRGRTGKSRPTTTETDRMGPARNTSSTRPRNGIAAPQSDPIMPRSLFTRSRPSRIHTRTHTPRTDIWRRHRACIRAEPRNRSIPHPARPPPHHRWCISRVACRLIGRSGWLPPSHASDDCGSKVRARSLCW